MLRKASSEPPRDDRAVASLTVALPALGRAQAEHKRREQAQHALIAQREAEARRLESEREAREAEFLTRQRAQEQALLARQREMEEKLARMASGLL